MLARILLFWFFGLVYCGDSNAHVRSESYSRWKIESEMVSLSYTISAREVTRIAAPGSFRPATEVLRSYLANEIAVKAAGELCPIKQSWQAQVARRGYLKMSAAWHCATPPDALAIHAFFNLAPEHVHFATIALNGNLQQVVLSGARQAWDLPTGQAAQHASNATETGTYIKLGVIHIATGFDHIAFITLILLACRSVKDSVLAISGFTLGHSLTLALSALGLVEVNLPIIEATIGASIALLAVERAISQASNPYFIAALSSLSILVVMLVIPNTVSDIGIQILLGLSIFVACYLVLAHDVQSSGWFRILITTIFGLIHGFGFANAFSMRGLPVEILLPSLFTFNLGVELGQLAVIAILAAIGHLVGRRHWRESRPGDVLAAVLCGYGVFLFTDRLANLQ